MEQNLPFLFSYFFEKVVSFTVFKKIQSETYLLNLFLLLSSPRILLTHRRTYFYYNPALSLSRAQNAKKTSNSPPELTCGGCDDDDDGTPRRSCSWYRSFVRRGGRGREWWNGLCGTHGDSPSMGRIDRIYPQQYCYIYIVSLSLSGGGGDGDDDGGGQRRMWKWEEFCGKKRSVFGPWLENLRRRWSGWLMGQGCKLVVWCNSFGIGLTSNQMVYR